MNVCCYGYPLCSCEEGDVRLRRRCKYGDPLCPCQDGGQCHYEGTGAMVPRTQEVVCDFPPIYSKLSEVFRLHERRDVVFSFGPKLFNPYGVFVPDEIIAHEAIHGARQGESLNDIHGWWKRYMADPTFRLVEEIHAHRAECQWLLEHNTRRRRRAAIKQVAAKLAAPLYGSLVTPSQARKLLKAETYGTAI